MPTLLPSAAAPFLYAALAATLLWSLSRFLRPLSLPAALALGLLPLTFTGPALLTGRVYAPLDLPFRTAPLEALRSDVGLSDTDVSRTRYDVAFQIIPWRKAVRYAIKNGEWPLLNPFILSGDILAAAGQPAPYHPLHLLSYLLPLGPSLTFLASAVLFLTNLGSFYFLREIDCRESAALLGAVAWTFSGFTLFWIGWPLGMTVAFFPLLLLAVRRTAREPGGRSLALLTAAFVLLLLAGHPESVWHCVAAAMVYGLFELLAAPRRRWLAAAGAAGAAGALALLLCAVDLLPFLDAMTQTAEFHGRRMIYALTDRTVPWPDALERLRTVVVPFAYGVPWKEWIRAPGFNPPATPATGVLLAPMLFGLWRGRWRGRWLMLGFAAAGLLTYVSAPGLSDLLAHLPLFDIAINRRLVFVAAFAFSVLAALGAEAWARRGGDRRMGWLSLGALLALAALTAGLWPGMREAGLSTGFLRQRTLLELVPLALATGLFLTVRSTRLGVLGLAAILLVQRLAVTAELNRTYPQSLFYPPVAELETLPRDGAPYRIAGLRGSLTPNLSALYELEDARGYQVMKNLRLYSTYPLWSGLEPVQAHNARIDDLSRPFLSLLNVRFALVAERDRPPPDWRPWAVGRGFAIYENPRALPRAFIPERVRIDEPVDRRLRDMAKVTDFSRLAWIENAGPDELHPPIEPLARWLLGERPPSASDDLPPPNDLANGPGRVRVERRGLGLHLGVEMERPGWVVVSQTAWRGWRASTGGHELRLHFADQAFLAFHLPRGSHTVELAYRPRSFVLGLAVSSLTAGAVVLFLLGSAWRRLRDRSPRFRPPPPRRAGFAQPRCEPSPEEGFFPASRYTSSSSVSGLREPLSALGSGGPPPASR